jgi:sigma-B regulation protein RsbU (phosphoserine phosphatase)
MPARKPTGPQQQVAELTLEKQRLEGRVGELSLLIEIASAISSTLSVEEINRRVVELCVKSLDVEQGAVHLLQSKPEDLLESQVRVFGNKGDRERLRMNPALIGWMLKHRSHLVTNDLGGDSRFRNPDTNNNRIRSLLSVPLYHRDKVIGFLTLFNKLSGRGFTSDDERILGAIAAHCAQVIEMARLNEQELRLRAHECQLKEARRIQMQTLPQTAPVIEGIEIAGQGHPAASVGGDYYGYIRLRDDRWGIAVADVTGHGIGAALMMSDLQATLRASAHLNQNPRDCVAWVNWLFSQPSEHDVSKHASLFYAVIEPATRTLKYTNAGHNPPLLIRADGSVTRLSSGGVLLGVLATSTYELATVDLRPGDLLLIYTDGITEAPNTNGEMFEEERLLDNLQRHRNLGAAEIITRLMDDLQRFQGDEPLQDDVTLVCLKVHSAPEQA